MLKPRFAGLSDDASTTSIRSIRALLHADEFGDCASLRRLLARLLELRQNLHTTLWPVAIFRRDEPGDWREPLVELLRAQALLHGVADDHVLALGIFAVLPADLVRHPVEVGRGLLN